MRIADQQPGLIEKIADALREAGYTKITVHHSSSSATIAGQGAERSLIVQVIDPALAPVPGNDGRFTSGLAASTSPPVTAVKAFAAGTGQRGGSSST
ncbi:hypothetical protein [Frankia sp. Cj3]|uniref:hypothetical protein n=1 Tax=Frankia sp. Cj3 TaxID=2880976 RepID=UPI001EF3DE12|nr:hypothetical protein [Frankia sp. Cj3]